MPKRNHRLIAAFGGATLLLAGCNLAPDYETPTPPAQTETLKQLAERSEAAVDPVLDASWERFFTEDRLRALIGLALKHNTDLRSAAIRVERAAARLDKSIAEGFPALEANAGVTRQRTPASLSSTGSAVHSNRFSATAGFTAYELDLFGAARNRNEAARQSYFSTAEAAETIRLALIAQVARQDLTYRAALAQAELARQTQGSYAEALQLITRRFEVGTAPELDLRSAEAQLEQARLTLAQAEATAANELIALEDLLGTSLPLSLPAAKPLSADLLPALEAGLPSDLLLRRPDVRAAEFTLRSTYAGIGVAKAAFFPSLSLTATGGSASSSLEGLFGSNSTTWTVAPQLRLPLLDWGERRADLDDAELVRESALLDYEATVRGVFREVAEALVGNRWSGTQLDAARALSVAQERRLEQAEIRYEAGVADYLSVLTAQQALFAARRTAITAEFNELAQRVALYRVLGGGWSPATVPTF